MGLTGSWADQRRDGEQALSAVSHRVSVFCTDTVSHVCASSSSYESVAPVPGVAEVCWMAVQLVTVSGATGESHLGSYGCQPRGE